VFAERRLLPGAKGEVPWKQQRNGAQETKAGAGGVG